MENTEKMERQSHRRDAESAEKGEERFSRARDQHEAKAPASLRKITQGRQDRDAGRIARDAEKCRGSLAMAH